MQSMLAEFPVVNTTRTRNIAFEGITRHLDRVRVATNDGIVDTLIPALHRTNYWAILKYMYLNHSRRVFTDELVRGVEAMMEEEDCRKWDRFKAKTSVKTIKNDAAGNPCLVEQKAKTWQDRLITNGRNLCRVGNGNAYGKRLLSRGHVLRYGTDEQRRSYFFLSLELTPENTCARKRGRKAKLQTKEVCCGS